MAFFEIVGGANIRRVRLPLVGRDRGEKNRSSIPDDLGTHNNLAC